MRLPALMEEVDSEYTLHADTEEVRPGLKACRGVLWSNMPNDGNFWLAAYRDWAEAVRDGLVTAETGDKSPTSPFLKKRNKPSLEDDGSCR